MTQPIQTSERESIVTITLNNPEKRNALTLPAWEQLGNVVEALSERADVRCIVVRGAGDAAFAAGADIAEFPELRSTAAQAKAYGDVVTRTIQALRDCPHPTLAMIKGACTGGGLEIACACDIRLAGESSRYGVPINRIGHTLAYPELGAILRLVSPSVMMDMLLAGTLLGSGEALNVGLINRIYPDSEVEAEALKTAKRIAGGAPLAARMHKRMIRRLATGEPLTNQELDEAFACCDSADYAEGFEAFIEKRKPVFTGK